MKPLISVVVLNWNGGEYLRACLDSIFRQDYDRLEVIVVDNGSTDRSVEVIRACYPTVRVIENGRNIGFAAGNNVGIREAAGDYILILNNDAELEVDCISVMRRAIEIETVYGACASKILLKFEEDLLDAAGIVVCPDGLSIGRGRLERGGTYDNVEEVFFGSGCCILCRKEMLEDVKLGNQYFDETFFMYADDTDLGWRAALRGWRCIYEPGARAYHLHSASSETYSPLKAFLVERNRIWIGFKYFPLSILLYGQFFTIARYFFQAWGVFAGKGASGEFTKKHSRGDLMGILLKVYLSALKGLPEMIAKRRQIRHKRTITTGNIRNLLRLYGIRARDIAFRE